MRNVERAAPIESNAAVTIETIEDHASMAAGETTQPIIFELLVELAFFGVGLENVLQCGSFGRHKICLPNAERINSVPNWAVLLWTSRIGLISVISKETNFFVSAINSIAR